MVHLHSGPSVLCPDCLLPSPPCGATGTGRFRREPSNSTGGTQTHERNHLHGLLRCDLKRGSMRGTWGLRPVALLGETAAKQDLYHLPEIIGRYRRFSPLTPTQWLPKPATIWFPHKRCALRAPWSPLRGEGEKGDCNIPIVTASWY